MFGLNFEKIVIVGIIAAIVLGPSRLPHYAQKLGELARLLRAQIDVARDNASESLGVEDWQSLDPHQYEDRKSTRLNSSHVSISYAVFCLKKKKLNKKTSTSY